MNFLPWFVVWVVMALVVLLLAAYRKTVTRNEDDSIHVSAANVAASAHQVELAQKIAKIDKLGKSATVVAVVYGVALLATYLYQVWTSTATMIQQ
ncbi:MAG TPA: hypothetical protein VMA31_10110 [Bryobacteraceae bacterium]|nr:hypothetical protein [Bryobacteraceae bacterium]